MKLKKKCGALGMQIMRPHRFLIDGRLIIFKCGFSLLSFLIHRAGSIMQTIFKKKIHKWITKPAQREIMNQKREESLVRYVTDCV